MAWKMVVVPNNVYSNMQQVQKIETEPVVRTMTQLDEEISRILSRNDIRDDEKVKLYNAMQKYLEYEKQRTSVEPLPVKIQNGQEDDTQQSEVYGIHQLENEILDSVPKTSKGKAQRLLNKLRQNKNVMYWNERGEMLYNGKPIAGTNIVDLVRDLMTDRKNFQPSNRELFARGLARMNTPLIGSETKTGKVQFNDTIEVDNWRVLLLQISLRFIRHPHHHPLQEKIPDRKKRKTRTRLNNGFDIENLFKGYIDHNKMLLNHNWFFLLYFLFLLQIINFYGEA